MPHVVNVRDRVPYDVYVGRANRAYGLPHSKWANPFVVGPDGTRASVVERYRARLLAHPDLLAALPELKGLTLACWCAPQACHADVLVELANTEEHPDAAP